MTAPTHRQLDAAVPRYTSYPTAPHFHTGIDADAVTSWIDAIPAGDALSIYLHIPFCDRLCWFCACHTKQTLRYEPVAAYVRALIEEIRLIGWQLGGRAPIRAMHFGGGSPTMLSPDDLRALRRALDESFPFTPDASISVEIDPNDMTEAKFDALAEIGLTRASLGIQDFAPEVQRAINREQSLETTAAVIAALRVRGVGSLNLDLLYGLPHQTVVSLAATVAQALNLRPDRIALFGYAHVPWFKKHQTMIAEAALPGGPARLELVNIATDLIQDAGYDAIGMDHFAMPGDALAIAARAGALKRNFQGYTEDVCETLIGLGVSSVSRFREGYAQTTPATGDYMRRVATGQLAIAKGIALSDDDRLRGWIIERLMCDFAFSVAEAYARFGQAAQAVIAEASILASGNMGLSRNGDWFVVMPDSRRVVRTIAARFDTYLATGTARHSVAV